ncbi:MAG: Ig-like domain-containing protein [Clostridia bacterium]|nr:Ig-like domain-containing protein [Clostridia bacterium]MBQ9958676.1 Ig-like domain-containing protein [Clostridia bacterium]
MNIKKILAVLLTLAIVLVSFPAAVSAYTTSNEPECYLAGFNSSGWSIVSGAVSFDNDAGHVVANDNNAVEVKSTAKPIDLSKGFAFQLGMLLQGDDVNSTGTKSHVILGDMRVRFVTAQATTGVQYIIQKDGAQVAIFNSGVTHQNGNAPSDELKAYSDGFFTITYNDGKVKMYNDKIKSDENPTGIITWKLNDGTYSTEVGGWENDDFISCTPEIKKEYGGPNSVHTVLSDLYLCDYDYFVSSDKPVLEKQTQVNITCIGDSITHGVGTYSGYRYYLYENLYKQGLEFNFVGPYTTDEPRLPTDYSAHSGYPGAVIGPNTTTGSRSTYDYLPQYVTGSRGTADIALVMIGHNNYFRRIDMDNMYEVYKNFLLRIFELAPDITVYCASLINNAKGISPDIEKGYTDNGLNALLPTIVAELQAEGHDARFFDLRNATKLSSKNGDFYDSDVVHPNEQGQEKMGNAWASAISAQVKEMNDAGEGSHVTRIVPTTGISLDKDEVQLTAGGFSKRVYANVEKPGATIDTVIWESSDESIATVDIDGLVTPIAEGECTITARTLSGDYTDTCKANVASSTSLTPVFTDKFSLPERWVGSGQALGTNGITISYPSSATTYDTRRHYPVQKGFKVSASYTVSGNNNSFDYYSYTSFGFGGLEMRIAYGSKQIELYHNSTLLGSWTNAYLSDKHQYDLYYYDGLVQVARDGEVLIETTVPYEELENTSPVKFYSYEYRRNAQTHSVSFETTSFNDEYYVESSPIDTDEKKNFESVLKSFDADSWTVSAENSSIINGSVNVPNDTTLVKYKSNSIDVSKGFQMQLDFNWNNYTRYYGEAVYYTIGDVTFRLRNAYDITQSRNYPLYLCVYENSVFDEETGALTAGDLIATMISDATGEINQSSDGILDFMNATYTIYYDGSKLYIKNSNLGTINFILADGSLGTGIEIDPSQFEDASIQIYKESMGNSGNMLSNFILSGRDAGGLATVQVGDLNGDYAITASDVLVFSQHLLGITSVDSINTKGDMNTDGIVDSTDLTILKMNILGMSE